MSDFLQDIKLKDFPVESKLGKHLKEYSEKFKREVSKIIISLLINLH
jgi:hypothetical protein